MSDHEESIRGRHCGISPDFPLPEETRPGMVHLQVSDLARSIDYYVQVLGLTVLERTFDNAMLGAPRADHPLICLG